MDKGIREDLFRLVSSYPKELSKEIEKWEGGKMPVEALKERAFSKVVDNIIKYLHSKSLV